MVNVLGTAAFMKHMDNWITQVETSHVDTASKIIDNANANVSSIDPEQIKK